MALTTFNKNVSNIQALGDNPNTDNGLTATQLKQKFDKAAEEIKDFINNTLIPELNTLLATIPAKATSTPQPLGTAAIGNSSKYAAENHVHKMPTASDVGAAASNRGMPSGGTTGQVLSKSSGTDYAVSWTTPTVNHDLPTGGTNNQMLVKNGSTNYAAKWVNQPTIPSSPAGVGIKIGQYTPTHGSGANQIEDGQIYLKW